MITFTIGMFNSSSSTWITKDLWHLFEPDIDWESMSEDERIRKVYELNILPTSYKISGETYCRNADRTSDYELENIENVNRKVKVEFVWTLLKVEYLQRLLTFVKYKEDYRDIEGVVNPEDAPVIQITFKDFLGTRTINAYLGQSIETTLVEYDGKQYYEELRLAFPER